MKRRAFLTLLGGAASIAMPRMADAQRALLVVGWIDSGARAQFTDRVNGFLRGLGELGFEPGRNIVIEDRWAEGQYDRLPRFAAELAQKKVAVLVATGAVNSSQAAIAVASSATPVVFANGGDPVALGLIANLNRPAGNATGVSFFIGGLGAKRLEMMRTLAPAADVVALLVNLNNPVAAPEVKDMQEAGRQLGLRIVVFSAGNDGDIDTAFAEMQRQGIRAVLVNTDSFLSSRRARIADAAARDRLPAIYAQGEFVKAGGLMSYGTDLADGYRQAGVYAAKILNGAKPADLPVLLPAKFEMIVNLPVARALGVDIPPTLLTQADTVIE